MFFPTPIRPGSLLRPTGAVLLVAAALSSVPLVAQATSTSLEKFKHSPAVTFDSFGKAVAVEGDRALITAIGVDGKGAAFSYRRHGDAWDFSQKFRGADTLAGDAFGFKAQIAGDYAVLSGHQKDKGALFDAGAAYVFHDDGTTWTQVQKLEAPDPAASDFFGWSVSMGGDLIVVGAIDDDDGGNLTGSAYVFRRSGPTWVFEQKLHASDAGTEDEFGFDVDTDGQTIVISTPMGGLGAVPTGSVYVFKHDGTSWVEVQHIGPADGAATDYFGWDIQLDGNRLAIGAPKRDLTKLDGGAVYLYRDNGTRFVLEDEFAPSKVSASDVFGWSVALQGDRLVSGAPSTTIEGGSPDLFDGALYQFHFNGSRWVEAHQWLSADVAVAAWPGPNLGQSCALDGTTVFAGAPFHDGGAINSGAAYRFELTDLGLDALPDSVPAGGQLTLTTDGGLAGAKAGLLVTAFGGTPISYVIWISAFDAQGKSTLEVTVPAVVSGFDAVIVAAGFWHAGPFTLSNPVTVSFQ